MKQGGTGEINLLEDALPLAFCDRVSVDDDPLRRMASRLQELFHTGLDESSNQFGLLISSGGLQQEVTDEFRGIPRWADIRRVLNATIQSATLPGQ